MESNQQHTNAFNKSRILAVLVFVLLALSILISPTNAAAASSNPVKVQIFYYPDFTLASMHSIEFPADQGPRIVNGRVLVPLRIISQRLGYVVNYDSATKKITIDEPSQDLHIQLTVGSKQSVVNGRSVTIDVPPDVKNGITFVPLRFVSECFDLEVSWDAAERTVTLKSYMRSHPNYLLDMRDSKLYLRDPNGYQKHIYLTTLGFRVDDPYIKVVTTGKNNHLIRITHRHGGAHMFVDTYDVYVANGKVVAQGHFGTSVKSSDQVISADGKAVVIADNKQAVIYDDATLKPVATYDLIALFGFDPSFDNTVDDKEAGTFYQVVGYGNNYLIVRSGFSVRMALAYLDTKEVVWLEKVFYDEKAQCFVVDMENSFQGDFLSFLGERDGNLIFGSDIISYNSSFASISSSIKEEYSYPLKNRS